MAVDETADVPEDSDIEDPETESIEEAVDEAMDDVDEEATDGDASDEAEAAEDADSDADTSEGGDPRAVGVKLGSTRTVIVQETDDGLETATSLTCLATYEDAITGEEQVLYGEEAATQYPDRVQYMLRSGLPEDDERAELAATFFEELVAANDVPEDSVVVYAIPTIDNDEGLENLESVIENRDIGDALMRSYPESLCGSIPAVGDGLAAIERIFVAVNLGSTNLEACAYRRGEQLSRFATGGVTGNEVDRWITNYVEDETQGRVNIDTTTAREYKEEHADFEDYEPFTDVIQQPGGGAHEFTIEDAVMDAVDEYVDEAVEEIANTFLPQLANDYMKTYQNALEEPIVVTGGMVHIPGLVEELEERLAEELQRDVEILSPDEPVSAAATGAQRIAARLVDSESH